MKVDALAGVVGSFKKEVTEEFGNEIFIPEYEDHPITSAEIIYPPTGDKKDLLVVYSKRKGSLMDVEFIKKYETSMNSKVLYGLYDGEPWLFRITYSNFKITDGNDDSETKDLNGVVVKYNVVKTKGSELLVVFFNLKDGSYSIEFILREGLTKGIAFDIVDSIIKETNKKQ